MERDEQLIRRLIGEAATGSKVLTGAEERQIVEQEWPIGTTQEEYLASIRQVIRDRSSGLFTSLWYGRERRSSIVRQSGSLRGPGWQTWVRVEYGLERGFWITACLSDSWDTEPADSQAAWALERRDLIERLSELDLAFRSGLMSPNQQEGCLELVRKLRASLPILKRLGFDRPCNLRTL